MSPAELDFPVLLTPEHIRRREFVTTRRGYDPEQVRFYLEQVAMQVEEMEAMLRQARADAGSAQRAQPMPRSDPYEQLAQRVGSVLRAADAEADKVRRQAQVDTEAILREARSEAKRIRIDAQARAEEARAEADRALREARERADRTISGLSSRRDEVVGQLAQMQERLVGVAKELEEAIERRGEEEPSEPADDAAPKVADTWAGWAQPTMHGPEQADQAPQPQASPPSHINLEESEDESEELFSSEPSETVDLTFPEIPPLDLDWDDEDD
jgi:cell division initiation protein